MITLVTGPMGAGKSTELSRLIRRALIAGERCIAIVYAGDTRYSSEWITTHDSISLKSVDTMRTLDLMEIDVPKCDFVVIDEAQFIKNVKPGCDRLLAAGVKKIVIGMLNADYMGRPFENTGELFSYADKVHFLTAICTMCGRKASMTASREADRSAASVEKIGGMGTYAPVCKKCHPKFPAT